MKVKRTSTQLTLHNEQPEGCIPKNAPMTPDPMPVFLYSIGIGCYLYAIYYFFNHDSRLEFGSVLLTLLAMVVVGTVFFVIAARRSKGDPLQSSTFIFDLETGKFSWTNEYTRSTTQGEYDLSEFQSIEFCQSRECSHLTLISKKRWGFGLTSVPTSAEREIELKEIAQIISEFTGIPQSTCPTPPQQ
jgi:hypothetical protein